MPAIIALGQLPTAVKPPPKGDHVLGRGELRFPASYEPKCRSYGQRDVTSAGQIGGRGGNPRPARAAKLDTRSRKPKKACFFNAFRFAPVSSRAGVSCVPSAIP